MVVKNQRFTKPRKLERTDNLEEFSCSVSEIDDWLHHRAFSSLKSGTAITYLSFSESGKLAGFYSLSSYSIARHRVHGWLARNTPLHIPTILLGQLGVDQEFQSQGLGWRLLHDAVLRSLSVASYVGSRALVVEPVSESAAHFYHRFGFEDLPDTGLLFYKLVPLSNRSTRLNGATTRP